MAYEVRPTPSFQRQVKALIKKYPSLLGELLSLGQSLGEQPTQGTSLGKQCYKVRLAIASKGKGKSGGAQVITHLHLAGETVYLLSIYDKSEKENLPPGELEELLKQIQP